MMQLGARKMVSVVSQDNHVKTAVAVLIARVQQLAGEEKSYSYVVCSEGELAD